MQGWSRVLTIPELNKWLPRGSAGMLVLRPKPHIYVDVIYAHVGLQQKRPKGLPAFRLCDAIACAVPGFSCFSLGKGHLNFHPLIEIRASYSHGPWG